MDKTSQRCDELVEEHVDIYILALSTRLTDGLVYHSAGQAAYACRSAQTVLCMHTLRALKLFSQSVDVCICVSMS